MTSEKRGWKKTKKPITEVTISMKKLRLICDYYELPLAVFFTDEKRLREMIKKRGTREKAMRRYKDALDRIRDIIEETYQ
jgi:hypothetical protein